MHPTDAPIDTFFVKLLFAVQLFAPAIVGIVLSIAWVWDDAETAFVEVLVTEPPAPSVTLPEVVIAVFGDIPVPGVILVTVPCGGVMQVVAVPVVDVVTVWTACAPVQLLDAPVLAMVELPIRVAMPVVAVYDDLSACHVSLT